MYTDHFLYTDIRFRWTIKEKKCLKQHLLLHKVHKETYIHDIIKILLIMLKVKFRFARLDQYRVKLRRTLVYFQNMERVFIGFACYPIHFNFQ